MMTGNETDLFVGVAQQALWVTALVAAPLLLAALAIGLVVGIVQAATSINEQTLSFVPKLLVCAIVLALLGGSMLTLIGDFTRDLFAMVQDITA
jgi:flagellar biosynthesis protein FliQ